VTGGPKKQIFRDVLQDAAEREERMQDRTAGKNPGCRGEATLDQKKKRAKAPADLGGGWFTWIKRDKEEKRRKDGPGKQSQRNSTGRRGSRKKTKDGNSKDLYGSNACEGPDMDQGEEAPLLEERKMK